MGTTGASDPVAAASHYQRACDAGARAGCNNLALTWPVGTPLMTVVNAVSPPGVTESIFTLDAAQGRFRGYSPTAPSFANDFTMVETSLQAVYICVTASSTLNRPVAQ